MDMDMDIESAEEMHVTQYDEQKGVVKVKCNKKSIRCLENKRKTHKIPKGKNF